MREPDDAPEPTDDAARLSRQVIDWARLHDLPVTCVDADVLGGVAVYLGRDDREAWIACMNDGAFTAVLSQAGKVVDHFPMGPDGSRDRVIGFLIPDGSSAG